MQNTNGRTWAGIIFIAIGALFLLENFGFPWFYGFDISHMIFSWHSIFLIIGIVLIINHRDNFLGYIFVGIGAFGMLRHIPFFSQFDFSDLWPIALLFMGLWLILRRNGKSSIHHSHFSNSGKESTREMPPQEERQSQTASNFYDFLDEVNIFNSTNKVIRSDNFRGGNITTIFGGTKLDLTNSKLSPSENILEITTLFGGTNIRVPQNWKVILNVTSIFGGFEDKRFAHIHSEEKSEGMLIIKGVALFGGGELLY
ncbi:MAG: LiaF-related protein [Ignavibacteriales bacterium]|nr:LiaF-related protein [Ignavibacteriales bacterium]